MKKSNRILRIFRNSILLVAFLGAATLASASSPLTFDGYYKNFSVMYSLTDIKFLNQSINIPPLGSSTNRLRLNAHWKSSRKVWLDVSYELAPTIQDERLFVYSPALSSIDPFSYRVTDFDSRLYPGSNDNVASFAVTHNLDRAVMTWRADAADVYFGRQVIAFGSARVINPTDPLAPYSYETLDTEDRIGIDALRIRIPIGTMNEIDIGYVFGRDFDVDRSAMFLRGQAYKAGIDFSLMALSFRENLLVGVDAARSVGGTSVWIEAANVYVAAFNSDDYDSNDDYFQLSAGMDYSPWKNAYLFAEYHYNGAGAASSENYLANTVHTAYTEGSVYLLGRHYLATGLSHKLNPLVTIGADVLANLGDRSAYLTPRIEYNVQDNLYLSGGGFIGIGRETRDVLSVRSEFRWYPDIFYASLRLYY